MIKVVYSDGTWQDITVPNTRGKQGDLSKVDSNKQIISVDHYSEDPKERVKRWRKENPEKWNACCRRWRNEHRDEYNAYIKEYNIKQHLKESRGEL